VARKHRARAGRYLEAEASPVSLSLSLCRPRTPACAPNISDHTRLALNGLCAGLPSVFPALAEYKTPVFASDDAPILRQVPQPRVGHPI
jgi:hypothetical protein